VSVEGQLLPNDHPDMIGWNAPRAAIPQTASAAARRELSRPKIMDPMIAISSGSLEWLPLPLRTTT
jgi:hypothetical protein